MIRCPLRLVHAYPDVLTPPARGFSVPELELRAEADDILHQATQRLRDLSWTGTTPECVVRPGAPAHVLVQESEGQRMLVVGRRGRSAVVDMLIGSTAVGTADHAKVPAVVVPDHWHPAEGEHHRIVLGVDGSYTGDGAVEFAFNLASRTESPVQAVHVCQSIDPYLPVEVFTREYERWVEAEERLLAEQLAGWQEKYPDVEVRRDVLGGHPVGVLLSLAWDGQLIVVGGRAHAGIGSAFVGWVGRNLIHHAVCPVAIVHKGADGVVDGVLGEPQPQP